MGAEVVEEIRLLVARSARDAIASPPSDLGVHWRLLARYVSYHVADLHSLTALLVSRPGVGVPTNSRATAPI